MLLIRPLNRLPVILIVRLAPNNPLLHNDEMLEPFRTQGRMQELQMCRQGVNSPV
jgi:hypothetical protein